MPQLTHVHTQQQTMAKKNVLVSIHTCTHKHTSPPLFIHPSSTAWGPRRVGSSHAQRHHASALATLAPWRGEAGWARWQPAANVLPQEVPSWRAGMVTKWEDSNPVWLPIFPSVLSYHGAYLGQFPLKFEIWILYVMCTYWELLD